MADTIQFRRDSASQWDTFNPILLDGEIGIETDTQRFKLGNGLTQWANLPFSSNRLEDDYFAYIDKEDITNISYGGQGEVSETTLSNGCHLIYIYSEDTLIRMDYTDVDGTTVVANKTFNYDVNNQLISVTKNIL